MTSSVRRRGPASALVAVLLAFFTAACGIHPSQPRDKDLIRVGDNTDFHLAGKYSPYFLPYAILAGEAYRGVDDDGRIVAPPRDYGSPAMNTLMRRWISDWTYRFGQMGPLCADGSSSSACGVPGLEYQVWSRGSPVCSEVAIVFRGTDGSQLGDWLSNIHWVTRFTPLDDQYEQVQANTDRIVDRVRRLRCHRDGVTKIVAVGHSLGGGLAQQAAWMNRAIRRVITFDSSFVTGSSDRHSKTDETRRGLQIDRVYEHGEILAYPRLVMRLIDQPTPCDPQIRLVRFNALEGSSTKQHSILNHALALAATAGPPRDTRAIRNTLPVASPAWRSGFQCSEDVKARPRRSPAPSP